MPNLQTKILCAIADTYPPGSSCTVAQITIAAWEKYEDDFSMEGLPYPDNNKVIACLSGTKRGMVKRGALRRVAPKTYMLTEWGLRQAQESVEDDYRPREKKATTSVTMMPWEVMLLIALDGAAMQKTLHDQRGKINFNDCLDFYGIRVDNSSSKQITLFQEAIRNARIRLDDAHEALVGYKAVSEKQINAVAILGDYLQERFRVQLRGMA